MRFRGVYDLGTCGTASSTVAFIKLEVSTGVVLGAHVERAEIGACLRPPFRVSQGDTALPIFPSLFPANSPTVAGDILLGSTLPCAIAARQDYPRRVNLTLLNAGADEAVFSVQVFTPTQPTPVLLDSFSVPAFEVRQVRLPIPALHSIYLGGEVRAWVEITSSQPYLAYASSIFENGAPDSEPFAVFPFRPMP